MPTNAATKAPKGSPGPAKRIEPFVKLSSGIFPAKAPTIPQTAAETRQQPAPATTAAVPEFPFFQPAAELTAKSDHRQPMLLYNTPLHIPGRLRFFPYPVYKSKI